jgi:ParB-like chromosome segregation protein Spo0J
MQAVKALTDIQMVPIASIKPYWRNPRKNDAAVPAVMASIKEFGVNQPIVVDKKNVIVVGHTRYRAMMELGMEDVPVVRADHLTAKKAREYRIADNKSGEIAKWNNEQLIPELRDTDLNVMGLFFGEADLTKMLSQANGVEFKPVDAEQLDAVLDRQQQSGPGTRDPQDGMVKLECPHCAEQFWVTKASIEAGGER